MATMLERTRRLLLAPSRLLIAAAASAGLLAIAPAKALNVDVGHYTLPNGLQLVVVPDHRAPVVTHMVWYKVGSADEPSGKTGLAHYLEHLLFKGTKEVPSGEFSKTVRANGGEENAFTNTDFTGYHQRIARDRLELVMKLESDRMANLQISDETVIPERAVVIEERRVRTDNVPASILREQMYAALFLAHPYGRPVVGWMPEVVKLTKDDAIDFYRRHYTPKNAIVVVAGDVSKDEVKALAEKYYGVLPNTADPPQRVRTPEPEPVAERRIVMRDVRAATDEVSRIYLAPAYPRAEPREAHALDLFAQILGGGATSRLYRRLVNDKAIAAGASASYSGDAIDYGVFGIYAVPNAGVAPEMLEAEIDGVLAEVVKDGITEEELARAKSKMFVAVQYLLDSQWQLAYIFGAALTTDQSVDDVMQWTKRIDSVTVDDVNKAAAKVLERRRSVTGYLLKDAQPQGKASQ